MADTKPKVVLQPTCDRPEASRRCTALVHRITTSHATIASALEVPKISNTLAKKILQSHLSGKTGLREFLVGLIVPIDPEKPHDSDKSLEIIANGIAVQTVVNVETVIAATVVVLSHSTADDVFTEALKIAIDLDPNGWLSELSQDTKVTLKDMYEEGVEGLFARALRSFRNRLGRKESLPSRAELLFRHIKILHNSDLEGDAPERFKLSLLKDADDLRVKIVHGTGLPKIDLDNSRGTMLFLHEAATTAIRSVGAAFHLPLDMEYFKQLAASAATPGIISGGH
jgi:hypothetical protein